MHAITTNWNRYLQQMISNNKSISHRNDSFYQFELISYSKMTGHRRKTTRMKYDPPYTKKPIIKGATNSNHHSVEEVSLDGSNKIITYGNTFRWVATRLYCTTIEMNCSLQWMNSLSVVVRVRCAICRCLPTSNSKCL